MAVMQQSRSRRSDRSTLSSLRRWLVGGLDRREAVHLRPTPRIHVELTGSVARGGQRSANGYELVRIWHQLTVGSGSYARIAPKAAASATDQDDPELSQVCPATRHRLAPWTSPNTNA